MAVNLNEVALLAVNVFSYPYTQSEGETRFAVYVEDSERGHVVTAAVLARGPVTQGQPHFGEEDEWYYGEEAREALAAVDAEAWS